MPSSARLKKAVQTAALLTLAFASSSFAQTTQDGFFTTSDGVKLHYLEAGQGESILFIPGWLMPAYVWQQQIDDLSKDYHVIALDPRSQGGSDMTPQGNDPLRRSKDIQELLDHLHLESVVLVGWSLGAFDALAYLHQFGPDKINGLVLVDSPLAAASGPAPAQRSAFFQHFESDRKNIGPGYVWSLFKKPLPPGFYKKMVQAEERIPTDIALAALDNTRPGDTWAPSLQMLRQLPILYAITPTYNFQAQYLQEVCAQARVEIFENCGHALFVDESVRFNSILRDFLKQTSLYPSEIPLSKGHHVEPQPTAIQLSPTSFPTAKPHVIPTPRPVLTDTPVPTVAPLVPTPQPILTFTPSPTPNPVPQITSSRPHHKKNTEVPGNPIQDGFFTTSDHVRLHYLEAGHGLTIVFIPGWLLPAEIWMAQLQDLSQDYHVVALDPRSQGQSDITPIGDEPLRQSKDIQELMDHLQVKSAVLVGWSHGAFQVLAYLNQFGTDRLYAVVLVDSSLGASSSLPDSKSRQGRFVEEYKKDSQAALRGFIWGLFKKSPPGDFIKDLNQSALRTPPDIGVALMNNIYPGDKWQPSMQIMRQVPLLYAVTPKFTFQAQYLVQDDPAARVEMFENTGHALFVDDPEHFNSVLRDFLRQAGRSPSGFPTRAMPKPTATTHP